MTEGMITVRLFIAQLNADNGNDCRTHIGEVIEGIGDYRNTSDYEANGNLNNEKNEVADNSQSA